MDRDNNKVDFLNLQAIDLLEKLGNSQPNEQQIALMESLIRLQGIDFIKEFEFNTHYKDKKNESRTIGTT